MIYEIIPRTTDGSSIGRSGFGGQRVLPILAHHDLHGKDSVVSCWSDRRHSVARSGFTNTGTIHRSAITHSCIPALAVWAFGFSPMAEGLALGIAFHLSSDLHPKSWAGGALIKFPVLGSIGMLSPIWLFANVIGCLAIFIEVVSGESVDARQVILGLCIPGACWYFLQEEKRPLWPLMALGVAILLVHAARGGTLSMKLVWQYFT